LVLIYLIAYLIFHLFCAVLTVGMLIEHHLGEYGELSRQDVGFFWLMGLIGGPLWLFITIFMTGFCEHRVK